MKKIRCIFLPLLLWLLTSSCQKDDNIVAWVEDAPITKSEMSFWMNKSKAEVYRYFYITYGVNDSEMFWSSTFRGESPAEMLKDIALQNAKGYKVEQILAHKKGVETDFNFDVLRSNMEYENNLREQKIQDDQIIYGPKRFTIHKYFSYQRDKMVYELKQQLAEQELKPTFEDMEALNPNSLVSTSDYKGFLTMQYVDENYEAFIEKRATSAEVLVNHKIWKTLSP